MPPGRVPSAVFGSPPAEGRPPYWAVRLEPSSIRCDGARLRTWLRHSPFSPLHAPQLARHPSGRSILGDGRPTTKRPRSDRGRECPANGHECPGNIGFLSNDRRDSTGLAFAYAREASTVADDFSAGGRRTSGAQCRPYQQPRSPASRRWTGSRRRRRSSRR